MNTGAGLKIMAHGTSENIGIFASGINEIIAVTVFDENADNGVNKNINTFGDKFDDKSADTNSDKSPARRYNAAPIGIICRGGTLRIVLFKGSHTLANILRTGCFTANFIHDSFVYAKCAFEDPDDSAFTEETVGGVTAARLADADGWILLRAVQTGESDVSCIFELEPVVQRVSGVVVIHPVNRGFGAVIDASVHATRYVRNHDPELKRIIDYDLSIARKCGTEREIEAAEYLDSKIR